MIGGREGQIARREKGHRRRQVKAARGRASRGQALRVLGQNRAGRELEGKAPDGRPPPEEGDYHDRLARKTSPRPNNRA